MGSNFFILGRGSKNILGSIFLFFEGVQIKIGVQFYLFWGATKNWGSNLFYFCGPKKLGVQTNAVQFFHFGSKKMGYNFFIFWVEGGSKKSGPIFGAVHFIYFCGPKNWGSNDLIFGV